MYLGKTLFAQIMEFRHPVIGASIRIVDRYGGDYRTRNSVAPSDGFRVMAFAQLTAKACAISKCVWRLKPVKHHHMGIGAAVAVGMADGSRDWRIYFELAQRLIIKARALYVDEDFGVGLANTVYALDATTIGVPVDFPWAPFRSTKAAGVKLRTLLDLQGSIPALHPHLRRQDARRQCAGPAAYRGRRLLHHGSGLPGLRAALCARSGGRLFRHARQAKPRCTALVFGAVDKTRDTICDQTIALNGFYAAKHYPGPLRRIRYRDPETGKSKVISDSQFALPAPTICALYRCRWQVELFTKVDPATAHQSASTALPRTLRERKSGSPSASTCWWRSSRRTFVWTCPCIRCYRSCR